MKESIKKHIRDDMASESAKIPVNGVLTVNFNTLFDAGILFHYENNKLSFWSNPDCETNEAFSDASVALCEAGGFDGPESHLMYDAVNRAELNIRLIKVLQNR